MSIYELVTSMRIIICKWLRFKTSVLKSEDELQVWYILVRFCPQRISVAFGLVRKERIRKLYKLFRKRRRWTQSFNPVKQSILYFWNTFGWKWEQKQKCTKEKQGLLQDSRYFKICSGSVRTLQEANEARYAISQQVLVHRITQFAAGIQFHVISSVWWLTCSQSVCLPCMVSLYKRLQVPGWLSEAGNGMGGRAHSTQKSRTVHQKGSNLLGVTTEKCQLIFNWLYTQWCLYNVS